MRPGGLRSVRQNEQKHPSASVASESGFSSCFRTVPAGAQECGLTPHLCVPEGLSDPSIFAASSCRPALLRHQQSAGSDAQLPAAAGPAPCRPLRPGPARSQGDVAG